MEKRFLESMIEKIIHSLQAVLISGKRMNGAQRFCNAFIPEQKEGMHWLIFCLAGYLPAAACQSHFIEAWRICHHLQITA